MLPALRDFVIVVSLVGQYYVLSHYSTEGKGLAIVVVAIEIAVGLAYVQIRKARGEAAREPSRERRPLSPALVARWIRYYIRLGAMNANRTSTDDSPYKQQAYAELERERRELERESRK